LGNGVLANIAYAHRGVWKSNLESWTVALKQRELAPGGMSLSLRSARDKDPLILKDMTHNIVYPTGKCCSVVLLVAGVAERMIGVVRDPCLIFR